MFKVIHLVVCCFFLSIASNAQQVDLMTGLNANVNESSGLIFLNQKIITHNDSGGLPQLYEIDSITGGINRTIEIDNSSNVDWEDITSDDDYIYIGDFGNNNGARTDLKIYRLSQQDFFNTSLNSASVDTIVFSYADQVDFTPTTYSTNFDAEALVAFNDSLYVFTKNWGNNWTNVYALPKTPGIYQVEKLDSINSEGLVTGATLTKEGSSIILCGYSGLTPFVMELNQIIGSDFSGSTISKYIVVPPTGFSVQIEGITALNDNQYYVTSEEFLTGAFSGLYKWTRNDLLSIDSQGLVQERVFPNPAVNQLSVECSENETMTIVDAVGRTIRTVRLTPGMNAIALESMRKGTYILRFSKSNDVIKITIM